MSRRPRVIVLDSWPILAYLEDEPSGNKVAEIMSDAHENRVTLRMSIINVGEVWYSVARHKSENEADQAIDEIHQLGIEFVDVDWKLTRQAASLKAKHKMAYADCFAAALAKRERAELVTGDKEFKQVDADIKINWV